MRRILVMVCVLCVTIHGRPVCAWNEVGHMIVARIAYERLSESERAAIVAILKRHPHFHELLLKDRPENVSEDEWVFLRAATWPDAIRPPRASHKTPISAHPIYRFHHATWHYANFEYRAGQLESSLPNRTLPHHPGPTNPADRTDVIQQLDHSYMIVRGSEHERSEPEFLLQSDEIRAIRICWLMHLIGDIHQPLHVATLVDMRDPALQHGDEGGNKLAIRTDRGSAPKQLHAFWDELLGTHVHYEKIVRTAEKLLHDPRLAATSLPEFASHKQSWEFADESYKAAKESIYMNGRLQIALWSRYENHELQAADIPLLSVREVETAHAIAERRIVLAGYRLAERLKFIVSRDGNSGREPHGVAAPPRRFQNIR